MKENRPPAPDVKRPAPKKKQPRKLSETYLRNSALYYLQRHPTSISHFLKVMDRKIDRSAKFHNNEDAAQFKGYLRDKVVASMVQAGFLNDDLYANALAASLRRRGLPQRAVQMRLKMKGLETPEAPEDHDDLKAAFIYARRKKIGPYRRADKDPKDPQKELAAMARAGFGYEVCSRVLKADPDDLETYRDAV